MPISAHEIEEVFARHPNINPPETIYVLDAPLVGQLEDETVILRGGRPTGYDKIILTPQGDELTVLHETIHTYGFGEFMAEFGSRFMKRVRQRIPPLRRRKVEYEAQTLGGDELGHLGIREHRGRGRIKKFVRRK